MKQELEQLDRQTRELAEKTLDLCRKHGIKEAKVGGQVSFEKRMVVEQDAFTLANSLCSQSLSLTVYHDQRKASVSTNSVDPKALEQMVINAKAIATFSVPDPYLTLISREQGTPAARLTGLFDASLAAISMQDIHSLMEIGLEGLRSEAKFNLDRFELTAKTSAHLFMNSNGVTQHEQQTSLNWEYLGLARDGEEVSGMDFDGDFTYSLKGVKEQILQDTSSFAKKVVKNLGAKPAESYTGQILLSPKAAADLILDAVLFHASGRAVMDKKSKWGDQLHKAVAHPSLTIVDRPHDLNLSGTTAFDSEGMPTKDQYLVKAGVLEQFILDSYSAKRLNLGPNAWSGGPFCLHLEGGQMPYQDMLKAQKTLLYVDRFSGNQNPLTGDFSGVAKSSRLYKDGVDQGPVTETMIAGNMLHALHKLTGLSREVERVSGGLKSPSILLDGISVTAGS